MKRIKILFFSNAPITMDYVSGTGNWVVSLLERLERFTSLQLFVAFHDNKCEELVTMSYNELTLFRIPTNTRKGKIGRLLDNWTNVDRYDNSESYYKNIIAEIEPDIIQIFGLESPFIRILHWETERIVIHIQGLLAAISFKYYPRFTGFELIANMPLIKLLKGNCVLKDLSNTKKHLVMEREIYSKIQHVLGRTDWDRRCLQAMAPQAIYHHCQEIMRSQFYTAQWEPKTSIKKIIYTTIRDAAVKNVDMIFETSRILDLYNSDFRYEWRIAGVSHNDITPRIMRKRGLLTPNIKLLGIIDAEQIINEMLNAGLFVYPSAIENSSNAVQEAKLLGIPILCTYAGGMSSIITHNVTGILISEGDPYSMAGAILEMFHDYQHSAELGRNARISALKENDPNIVIKQLLEAYSNILKQDIIE